MFNLILEWDRPYHLLDMRRPQTHVLRIRIQPQGNSTAQRGMPVKMAVALDVSESMGWGDGSKLKNAKKALKSLVKQLRPEDTLSVSAFSNNVKPIIENIKGGPSALQMVEKAINDLEADGGTCTDMALEWIKLALPQQKGTVRFGVLITDGNPSNARGIQLTRPEELKPHLELADKLRSDNIILCATGLGKAENFNSSFLDEISGGAFDYADNPSTLEEKLAKRLSSSQTIAFDNMRLFLTPKMNGVKPFAVCRIRPEFMPKDAPQSANASIRVGELRSDTSTDFLIEMDVPEPVLLPNESKNRKKEVLEVRLSDPDGRFNITETAVIGFTTSKIEAQTISKGVDTDRQSWVINTNSTLLNRTSDPSRTTDILTKISRAAKESGQAEIVKQTEEMQEEVKKTGAISSERKTILLSKVRKGEKP